MLSAQWVPGENHFERNAWHIAPNFAPWPQENVGHFVPRHPLTQEGQNVQRAKLVHLPPIING